MCDRFQDKYRIPSARLRNWDYGWNGLYFITICTAGHDPYFGVIENKKIVLSEIGKIAQSLWLEIPVQFPFIQFDTFVVMPNHVHGIIIIQKHDNFNYLLNSPGENCNSSDYEIINQPVSNFKTGIIDETGIIAETGILVESRLIASLQPEPHSQPEPQPPIPNSPSSKICGGFARNKNPMINDNLSRGIRWYKGRTTFESRKINSGFGWQTRFHDHIIRNDQEYRRIANYIDKNPANWGDAKFLNDD